MKIVKDKPTIRKIHEGSILSRKGYKAGGYHAGLRYSKKDLGIIVSDHAANAAAVYTQSAVQAAPILVTKESLAAGGKIQAVIVNSACANACTGERGLKDAYQMRNETAKKLGIPEHYGPWHQRVSSVNI